ncbi:diamine acetyltransferase 1-like [Acanthaster planci]|uniref:Diamine acetyltransferase 1-like n=1 Tax=Acanthaster planci TaxID=133434 RepID=A0A8B7ZAL4_ACAPL|nr:diamine acetyltransferase 1-like [Acanthaster planci]
MIFLGEFYIRTAHRGTGLGKALMEKVAEQAGIKDRCKGMNWLLRASNDSTWQFYRRFNAIDMTTQHEWRFMRVKGDSDAHSS